jgi:hypothetical protein
MTYVRFVTSVRDESSGFRQGLFQAIGTLQDRGDLLPHEAQLWAETRKWFDKNLAEPTSFARATRHHAKAVALSWFKDSAVQHIQRMRILAHLLEEHGVICEMVCSERPGYIVYEDAFQVVAEPFTDTAT